MYQNVLRKDGEERAFKGRTPTKAGLDLFRGQYPVVISLERVVAILQEIKITDVEEGASYTDETVVPNSVSINLLDDSSPKHVIHEEPRGEYLHVMEFSIELGIGISDEQIGMIDRVIEFDKKSVNISEEIGTGQIVKKLQKCFLNLGMSLGTWIDVLKKRE
ncbi:hypothetical protein V6N13_014951 [Hibiscus sabdariffa]